MLFVMFFTLHLLLPSAGEVTNAVALPLGPFSQQSSNMQQDNKQIAKMVSNFFKTIMKLSSAFRGKNLVMKVWLHAIPLKISLTKLLQGKCPPSNMPTVQNTSWPIFYREWLTSSSFQS